MNLQHTDKLPHHAAQGPGTTAAYLAYSVTMASTFIIFLLAESACCMAPPPTDRMNSNSRTREGLLNRASDDAKEALVWLFWSGKVQSLNFACLIIPPSLHLFLAPSLAPFALSLFPSLTPFDLSVYLSVWLSVCPTGFDSLPPWHYIYIYIYMDI